MFISSENSAAVITSNSEREILVLAGSFFDKTVCTGQRVLLFPGKRISKSLCVIRYV